MNQVVTDFWASSSNMLLENWMRIKVDGVGQRMQTDASLFCTCGQLPPRENPSVVSVRRAGQESAFWPQHSPSRLACKVEKLS